MCVLCMHTVCVFVYVGRTVTDVLMSVTYERPTKISGDNLRADQRLHNDLIDLILSTNARWPHQNLSCGQNFVKTLSSALWYIDHVTIVYVRGY